MGPSSERALSRASVSFATTSGGVPFGAKTAFQALTVIAGEAGLLRRRHVRQGTASAPRRDREGLDRVGGPKSAAPR